MFTKQVKNPLAIVLVKNVSNAIVCLPRVDREDLILYKGDRGQVTWAEYVSYKLRPHFGKYIELDDSVRITASGDISMRANISHLTEDIMIELLVLPVSVIMEEVLQMTEDSLDLFGAFLETRKDIGIEEDKCEKLLSLITKQKKKLRKDSKEDKVTVEFVDPDKEVTTISVASVDVDKEFVEHEDALVVSRRGRPRKDSKE